MLRRLFTVLAITSLVGWSTSPLGGIYVRQETNRVPVSRLVSNLEKQLAAAPKNPDLHIKLARLYGMAYSVNGEDVPVTRRPNGTEEVWFGHEPLLVPHRLDKGAPTRSDAAREFLKKATDHYRVALDLSPDNLLARLGYAWSLQEAGETKGAVAAYRAVIKSAWSKEQSQKAAELGQRFYTVEAAEQLVPLLDPNTDAQEIAELSKRVKQLQSVPRPITPLVVPLHDRASIRSIVDLDARVRFDADGSGQERQWTWISADAGWLVYDAEGKGEISSALQWFGNVSFWIMWRNGYEALSALDDNGDGELSGTELRYLAVWHDRNRDGVSDPGEVLPLARHGIVALSCRSVGGDGVLVAEKSEAGVRFENSQTRPTYDVILRLSRTVSAP